MFVLLVFLFFQLLKGSGCYQKNQINPLFFGGFGWAGVRFLKSDEFVSWTDKKAGSGRQFIKICIIFADNINVEEISSLKFKGYEKEIVDSPGGNDRRDCGG